MPWNRLHVKRALTHTMLALPSKQEAASSALSPTPWTWRRQRICATRGERDGSSGKPPAAGEGEQNQDRRDRRHRAKHGQGNRPAESWKENKSSQLSPPWWDDDFFLYFFLHFADITFSTVWVPYGWVLTSLACSVLHSGLQADTAPEDIFIFIFIFFLHATLLSASLCLSEAMPSPLHPCRGSVLMLWSKGLTNTYKPISMIDFPLSN